MTKPPIDLTQFAKAAGTVILDSQKKVRGRGRSWLFASPECVLAASQVDDVRPLLREAQRLLAKGKVLAGYLSYEMAGAFGLETHRPVPDLPLVWLGVYDRAIPIHPSHWSTPNAESQRPRLVDAAFNVSGGEYGDAVERVRKWIAAGDTYQANLTCKYRFCLAGADPFAYYQQLRRAHPVPFGAYVNLGNAQILSLSPELFLERRGEVLTSRPMKGTIPRGRGYDEDARLRSQLALSDKDRAENVMIVDLMRNDLGRVCETGSVRVPRLFDCERYNTVHQMTSTVQGRVRPECGLLDVLEAVFPCGSITGAPKHRTMQIIRDLETEPRGPYCGAIGWFRPDGDFALNVAIRTVVHRDGQCEMGVGSGITWGSDPVSEWEETQLKTRFLSTAFREFRLIETLRLTADGRYAFLDEHLARLRRSARYWDFRFPRKKILAALKTLSRGEEMGAGRPDATDAPPAESIIVRLALASDGSVGVTTRALERLSSPVRAVLTDATVDRSDPFLYHKTDRRVHYDEALKRARAEGYAEGIFRNDAGRLTGGCMTNLFIERDGIWTTPPVEEGLLPGVWREDYCRRMGAQQRPITAEDLARADRVVIGNSVRGAIEVNSMWDASRSPICLMTSRLTYMS